ncbi:hypothetical protein [Nostoc parmelioides]|uniref:Uncharacterized protein n=1 Tax=Nostoc parmelioides FACHB-3921 TaxID=2692909 RepID=A0ABR8BHN3_9NOSO|nr:hypothetical protein [Nostoc parmelioides]MBD2253194.1 hypothetical protein [Nostoc parmelioides FACHB-3921]
MGSSCVLWLLPVQPRHNKTFHPIPNPQSPAIPSPITADIIRNGDR